LITHAIGPLRCRPSCAASGAASFRVYTLFMGKLGGTVTLAKRWLSGEDETLRRMYASGAPLAAIGRELGRSPDAVTARRRSLSLVPRRPSLSWSPLEDLLLAEAARARLPATAVAQRLRRPVDQVRARNRQLGLTRPASRRYSAAEDALIRTEWPTITDVDAFARRLGRGADALRLRAAQLGLHRAPERRRWRAYEDAVLRDGYDDGLTCDEIAAGLQHRTATAVAARARKLGLATYARRWGASDDARLRSILVERSIDDAARLLGRTPEAVRRRTRKLGLARSSGPAPGRAGARWTAREDDFLALHAAANPALLAAVLSRSDRAVVSRLRHLGLRAGRWRSPHHPAPTTGGFTPGESALIDRELRDRGPRALHRLEDRLGRPVGDVVGRARAECRSKAADVPHRRMSSG
jgi:hypothetical protein